jgi:hypothetical protein
MSYRVQVSGKIFEGNDLRTLLKRAVEARQNSGRSPVYSGKTAFNRPNSPHPIDNSLRKT